MKKIILLSGLLILASACNFNEHQPKDSAQKEFISDHAHLEEAKAIARKLMEGLEKVEQNQISREDFENFSEPLQKQLNTLIISLEDYELRELETYRNELMKESAEHIKKEDPVEKE